VAPLPHIGGCETTGVVAKFGAKVRGLTEGQRVMIAPGLLGTPTEWAPRGNDNLEPTYRVHGYQTQGGLAEYSKAKAHDVLSISDAWSFAEWAAVPLTFMTAWNMLHERARLQPGDDVLIMGASSGVGVAGIQIAKNGGARVFAVAGTAEKLAKAEELGADFLINYNTHDVAKEVRKLTSGRGVDVVFEHVGPALFPAALKSLARNGRIVTCGATTGPKVEIDLRFFFTQQIVITGAYMGSRHHLLECLKLVERRELRPVVDSTFPLDQTRAAQERLQKREMFGKIVVVST
jgi:NADPH:quinone reductase-like Zn-dependent oxidoreductase